MTQEALKELLEAVEAAIQAGDWSVDGACDPDSVIKRSKEALAEHAMQERGAWQKQLTNAQRNELKQIEDGTWEADRNG